MHPPLAASKFIFVYITARVHQMIMQQQQPGTTLTYQLISRRLTRPRVASRSAFHVTGSGCGKKFSGALCAPVAEPPFLNF